MPDRTLRKDRGKHAEGEIRVVASGGVPGALAYPRESSPVPRRAYDVGDPWVALLDDFPRWAEEYLKIDTKGGDGVGGLAPFRLNFAQRYIHEKVMEQARAGRPIRVVTPKARQEGVSTYAEGLGFYLGYARDHQTAAVIAHDEDAVKNIFRKSSVYYDHLPDDMQLKTKYSNRTMLEYKEPHGSRMIVSVCGSGARLGQSYTIHFLHVSEISIWGVKMRNPEEAWDALMGAVPDNRMSVIIAESSAQGRDNLLYPLVTSALRPESEFEVVFLPWYIDPSYQTSPGDDFVATHEEKVLRKRVFEQEGRFHGYHLSDAQLYWRRVAIATKYRGNLESFTTYFPTFLSDCFAATDRGYFKGDTIEWYRRTTEEMSDSSNAHIQVGDMEQDEHGIFRFVEREGGSVTIYEHPKRDGEYALPADTSDGVPGGDAQYGVVIDRKNGNEVAHVHCRVSPSDFALILNRLGGYYNWARLAPERNRNPNVVFDLWHEYSYPNLHWMYDPEKPGGKASVPGWHTNRRTRPLMLERLREMVDEKLAGIRDPVTPDEMETFVYNTNEKNYQAAPNRRDDRVMAWAIGAAMLELDPIRAKREERKVEESRSEAFRRQLRKMRRQHKQLVGATDMVFGRSERWPMS
jgi:hypothetical protein